MQDKKRMVTHCSHVESYKIMQCKTRKEWSHTAHMAESYKIPEHRLRFSIPIQLVQPEHLAIAISVSAP